MLAVAACLVLCSPSVEPVRLAGDYDGVGTDLPGRAYRVSVRIRAEGAAYRVWWAGPGGQEFVGVGLRTGRQLVVSWAGKAADGRVFVGLTVYTLRADGSLAGRWTMIGAGGQVRAETLRPAA